MSPKTSCMTIMSICHSSISMRRIFLRTHPYIIWHHVFHCVVHLYSRGSWRSYPSLLPILMVGVAIPNFSTTLPILPSWITLQQVWASTYRGFTSLAMKIVATRSLAILSMLLSKMPGHTFSQPSSLRRTFRRLGGILRGRIWLCRIHTDLRARRYFRKWSWRWWNHQHH